MKKIKLSLDSQAFSKKPSGTEITAINNRIAKSIVEIDKDHFRNLSDTIGQKGHTFCPATFQHNRRNKDNFEQQQLFAFDFDNKIPNTKVSFDMIHKRADYYGLPIFFAYETLSSTNQDKFRIVFRNDTPIYDRRVVQAIQTAMGEIFSEADSSCYNDISKMYFGGKKILYYNHAESEINIESIFRNYQTYLKKTYKSNHYRQKIQEFSRKTGIALNRNGFLAISVTEDPTELPGAFSINSKNGKNSPTTIISNFDQSNIITYGEIFPKKYYCIDFISSTSDSSVSKTARNKKTENHKDYRSAVLLQMERGCKLYHDFISGLRKLNHEELMGLATNLIQVETGSRKFIYIRSIYPELYHSFNNNKWKNDLSFMKKSNYKPQRCDGYCPYRNSCEHSKNILSTVHLRRNFMEQIVGYQPIFYPLDDVQKDTYHAICNALFDNHKKYQIVKSMTGGGKSTSYLKLMAEHPYKRFLIAAPTNLLKDEIYEKALKMKISALKTPSLEQIKTDIPKKIWNHIQWLYKNGRHYSVYPYISEVLSKRHIPCLDMLLKERDALKCWDGNVITTHRYLLSMDEKQMKEYDAIIIDEDIIFKSIISNQCEISISNLEKLKSEVTVPLLRQKIKRLLKSAKEQSCIEMDSFQLNPDDEEICSISFDLPSFCLAERFYIRRKSADTNIQEDTVIFLKPFSFKDVKYIIVSATVNKKICCSFFGEENVDFYECKCAEYQGTLKQYPQKSMSRTCLANNPGMTRHLMEHFHMPPHNVITFMKENIGKLHFGNTEGSNSLEGQDVLVIGTPYHADFLYRLVAFTMDIDFDENETMTSIPISHNGYRFRFTTFQNEELRQIHFWMIESELEQAVGRARLLRNSCTVHLFSNFPLKQSQMVMDFPDITP